MSRALTDTALDVLFASVGASVGLLVLLALGVVQFAPRGCECECDRVEAHAAYQFALDERGLIHDVDAR